MKNPESVISIENIHKSFDGVKVLNGLSLEIEEGEHTAIIGPSGSGKSTLMQCINRLIQVDEGKILVEDFEITDSKVNIKKARQHIGMVFQEFNLIKHLTVLENVTLGPINVKKIPRNEAEKLAKDKLDKVGLSDKINEYPAQLSGGQKQRVGIARSLAMEPSIILFDEPTSSLDPSLTSEVLNVMRNLADDGITMVVVTHEMNFARDVTKKIALVDKGRIVEHVNTDEAFNNKSDSLITSFVRGIDNSSESDRDSDGNG